MMRRWIPGTAAGALLLLGCASTVQNVWTDPSLEGKRLDLHKVATVALFEEGALRRVAEDELARAIQQGGNVSASPSYTLLEPTELGDADRAAAKLRAAGFDGAVVVRVVDTQQRVTSTAPAPVTWGGYYGRGWGMIYGSPVDVRTDTIVQVQTDIYRIDGAKLLWSATSKDINPAGVKDLIDDVVHDVGTALREQGLIP